MSDKPKPIVVIDTQLILRAALNDRSLPARLLFDLGHLYMLAISPGIYAEAQDVLNRPKLRRKFTGLTDESVSRTLAVLQGGLQVIPDHIPTISRDPKDDIFLATANLSKAAYLVTEDQDLLVLHPYEDIQILNALDFLNVLLFIEPSDGDKP